MSRKQSLVLSCVLLLYYLYCIWQAIDASEGTISSVVSRFVVHWYSDLSYCLNLTVDKVLLKDICFRSSLICEVYLLTYIRYELVCKIKAGANLKNLRLENWHQNCPKIMG
jgi:hypothetical protein